MCNLYNMTATVDEMRRIFGPFEGDTSNLPSYDEIFPGYSAPVLRRKADGGLELAHMKWGFPGPQVAGGRPVTNVRNLNSEFWRNALTDPARRCIVPVTTFCEWTGESGRKTKVWFGLTEEQHPLFAFAGIWRPGEGGPFMAFLTCEANETVGAVHPKAMPVMLRPGEDVERWLGSERADACSLARPFADTGMRRVS
jgi:putative SOS response-associated peptidase YedK